ncbi:hypothetical protein COTS27_01301 [Spirochaetota bacterium]|nr:hypothetical protein COTS27_01301 [Spirochaetota bacterium]
MKELGTQSHALGKVNGDFKDVEYSLFFKSICLSWCLYTFMGVGVVFYHGISLGVQFLLGFYWFLWGGLIVYTLLSKNKEFFLKWKHSITYSLASFLVVVIISLWWHLFKTSQSLIPIWIVLLPMFVLFYLSLISYLLYALVIAILLVTLTYLHSPISLVFFNNETISLSDFSRTVILYTGVAIVSALGKYIFTSEMRGVMRRFAILSHENKDLLQKQKKIYYNAYYDILTGLYNRSMMETKILEAIGIAQNDTSSIAVLFIDLDNFKRINDNFGHRIGDFTLFTLAKRLRKTLYDDWFKAHIKNNENKGFVARLSGDEFIIVLVDVDAKRVKTICRNLVRACSKSYTIPSVKKSKTPRLSVSIGAAYMRFYGDKAYNVFQDKSAIRRNLLRHSDKGMYVAKRKKNTYHFLEY